MPLPCLRRFAFGITIAAGAPTGCTDDAPATAETKECAAQGEVPGSSTCDLDLGLCVDADASCGGLACGGSERGKCGADDTCACNPGFSLGAIDDLCCDLVGNDALCDFESPPGYAGGLCLAPDGTCNDGLVCNQAQNFCADPEFPCFGVACGGADRGTCTAVGGEPTCTCTTGFENEQFSLYCCPTDGSDPQCG